MTEKEKMLLGELYNAADPQLVAEHRWARNLTKELNDSNDDEQIKRQQILTMLFGFVGSNVVIEPPFYCDYGTNIHIGSDVFLNFNCIILDCARVEIGNKVLFGPNVQLYTATHPLDYQIRRTGLELAKPIRIGADVWVGGGSIVCPGVTIGERAVIGAGSVVTKDVPAGVLAVGNPCKVVRALGD